MSNNQKGLGFPILTLDLNSVVIRLCPKTNSLKYDYADFKSRAEQCNHMLSIDLNKQNHNFEHYPV